jgi:hypothetical protein
MYYDGVGVSTNDVIAYALADVSSKLDGEIRAKAVGQRDGIAESLNSADLASATLLSKAILAKGLDGALDDYTSSSVNASKEKPHLVR